VTWIAVSHTVLEAVIAGGTSSSMDISLVADSVGRDSGVAEVSDELSEMPRAGRGD
jgi:hypothetical protein